MANTTTIPILIARVQRRLKTMGQEMIPEIEAEVPLSCRALALQVMNDPQLSHLLYNTTGYTLSASSSAFDLSSHTSLLRESIPRGRLLITGWSYPASYYARRLDMERGTPAATAPRFCLEGDSIIAVASTAISNGTAANLKAHFVPTVHATTGSSSTLPDQLLPHLIELIAARIMGNIGGETTQANG